MKEVERLIKNFVPERYDIYLKINEVKTKIIASVAIEGEAKNSLVKLHAVNLNIRQVFLDGEKIEFEHKAGILSFDTGKAGKVHFVINYDFDVSESMHGVYASEYDFDGKKERIITTQFESHFAREAFPCVDEPEAKAVFGLTIVAAEEEEVISNMPIASERSWKDCEICTEEIGINNTETEFEDTPRMSTYLLAFCVGKFKKLTTKSAGGVGVTTYASLAQPEESLRFASETAVKCLDFFEEWFGVKYPLKKLDQIALPDFEAGAMENWGLMTFREQALLVNPELSPVSAKKYAATVIAHEISHMWFGDLVTMQWWDDLWLNESFANMMEYVAVDAVYPEFKIWQKFATYEAAAALRRDSLPGVQAVKQPVRHPADIQTMFDGAIVYAKGARLMYMLMSLLGEDNFRRGLRDYFKKFAYSNTTGKDLWQCLQKYADFEVQKFMDEWVNRPGYPVVMAEVSGAELVLRQKRFLLGEDDEKYTWEVPLFAEKLPKLLKNGEERYKWCQSGEKCVLELNRGSRGHYLSAYNAELLGNLLETADEDILLKLLVEQPLLAKTDLVKSVSLFEVVKKAAEMTGEEIWTGAAMTVRDLRWFFEVGTPEEAGMKRFVRELAGVQFKRLGWKKVAGEPEDDTNLRAVILGMLVYGEDAEILKQTEWLYDASEKLEDLDKDLRGVILAGKLKTAESLELVKEWSEVYRTAVNVDLKDDLCAALTGVKKPECGEYLLSLLKKKHVIKTQDVMQWFVGLFRNPYIKAQTWRFMQEEWAWFEETFGNDKGLDDVPRYAAGAMKTAEELADYKKFFEPLKQNMELKRNIEMGVAEIAARVKLIQSDGEEVRKYLRNA